MNYSKNVQRTHILSNWVGHDDESARQNAEKVLQSILDDVGSPFALGIRTVLNNGGSVADLYSCAPNPWDYDDPVRFYGDYQAYNFLRKAEFAIRESTDTKRNAMKAFIDAELLCMETNKRLSEGALRRLGGIEGQVVSLARDRIKYILGDLPDVSEWLPRFGPGATTDVKRLTTAFDKLSRKVTVSSDACLQGAMLLASCPGIGPQAHDFIIEDADQLAFVPKTSLTDRPIAVGPTLNVFGQAALGALIRECLLVRGSMNLNRLHEVNRERARIASLDRSLATIDLSSASDTISCMVVFELLPEEWFDVLNLWRSKRYWIEGKDYGYHKFSAMGNGFTFELESLIFSSLAWAASKALNLDTSKCSSFGDDIICPSGAAPLLCSILSECGFKINTAKSYWGDVCFRESCGGDFFNGVNVTPFRWKKTADLGLSGLVRFHNWLVVTGWRFHLKKTYSLVRKLIGPSTMAYLAGPLPVDGVPTTYIVDYRYPDALPFKEVRVRVSRSLFTTRDYYRMKSFILYRQYVSNLGDDPSYFDDIVYLRKGLRTSKSLPAKVSRTPMRERIDRFTIGTRFHS